MIGVTFIIGIIHAIRRLTVDADGSARMVKRTDIGIAASLGKALAAGSVAVAGVAASHHDIPLTAAVLLIIAAI